MEVVGLIIALSAIGIATTLVGVNAHLASISKEVHRLNTTLCTFRKLLEETEEEPDTT